jgi:hypothetical protein
MAVESDQVFDVLEVAYRTGVLDKALPLVGEAIDDVREVDGRGMSYLLTVIDETSEETLTRFDRVLGRSGILLRLAKSERLMRLLSRLMDLAAVRRATRLGLRRYFERLLRKSEEVDAWPAP